ncbi:MAG: POTRA domain-containing protein, partial [Pseudomonadota bacterium]
MRMSRRLGVVLIACLAWLAPPAWAERFVVKDIRIRGLERISAGTVLNYLPVKVGDEFEESRAAETVRALFKTGFFKDVSVARDGGVLIVTVAERETISEITLSGNTDIKSEDLFEALKKVGFAQGEVFDRSLLDKVEQELRRQYFSQGKYGVKVDSDVKKLGRNRVSIAINVTEGRTARIK